MDTDTTINDAARQLQASVSGFAQEDQSSQETLVALVKQVSAQLQTTNPTMPAINLTAEQPSLPEINPGELPEAARQLQAGVSHLTQEDKKGQDSLVALATKVSSQVGATEAALRENRERIEQLGTWIATYRH